MEITWTKNENCYKATCSIPRRSWTWTDNAEHYFRFIDPLISSGLLDLLRKYLLAAITMWAMAICISCVLIHRSASTWHFPCPAPRAGGASDQQTTCSTQPQTRQSCGDADVLSHRPADLRQPTGFGTFPAASKYNRHS